LESEIELTPTVVLLHPTITTFRFPEVCIAVYVTDTAVCGDCGVAEATWTKAGAATILCGKSPIPATLKNSEQKKVRYGALHFCGCACGKEKS
jgi:hypothetical protein